MLIREATTPQLRAHPASLMRKKKSQKSCCARLGWADRLQTSAEADSHTAGPTHLGPGRIRAAQLDQAEQHCSSCAPAEQGSDQKLSPNPLLAVTHCSAHNARPHAMPGWLISPATALQSLKILCKGTVGQAKTVINRKASSCRNLLWANCTLTVDFLVASACHTREEHCKDATGHVFTWL